MTCQHAVHKTGSVSATLFPIALTRQARSLLLLPHPLPQRQDCFQ